MRWVLSFMLCLFLAATPFAANAVVWSQGDAAPCKAAADVQLESAYEKCLSNCDLISIGGFFLTPSVKSVCRSECYGYIMRQTVDDARYGRCNAFCLSDHAQASFAGCYESCESGDDVASCTWACYSSGSDYPAFKGCWDGCGASYSISKARSAKDKAYIRCANSFSFELTDGDPFLYLPFGTTDGLLINVVWNYTDAWCSDVSTGPHHAIDFDGPDERPVLAAADGTVVQVVNESCVECTSGGYGAHVRIESTSPVTGKTYEIIYGHLRNGSIGLEEGDEVDAGDFLGNMSNTGNSQGKHLHFEVRDNQTKEKLDPYDLYGINECHYPLEERDYECGPERLWALCPPRPV